MTARVLPFTPRTVIVIDRVRDPLTGRLEHRVFVRQGAQVANVWAGENHSEARRVVADIEKEERARGRRCTADDRTRRVGDAPL